MIVRALVVLGAAFLSVAVPAQSQSQRLGLPDGPGKEIVQTVCTQCHTTRNITRSVGYTREGWQNTVAMMRNVGAKLPDNQVDIVVYYLAKNFPPKPLPPAKRIAGPVHVSIVTWAVPTPGSRPHDTLTAPDGTIWYTAHMANLLGHLNPKTGHIVEYRTTVPGSGPHGLTFDRSGNIWFTANFKGYIGEFDPRRRTFHDYRLAREARDPHTPLFDKHGTLWFTVQGANLVGRLDPQTGKSQIVSSPTPRSNPYGMVLTSKGVPIFAEFGSNKLARVDPATMAIHEYVLPHRDSRPRRVAITPDDIVYYTDYARGYLGRLDPRTGKITEWPSPGGPDSLPYGITYLKGAIWYSESGTRPNTLVRFDLRTSTFQTWTIPYGGGVVRNMMPTRDGNGIAMACSGVNRIALATIH